MGKRRIALTVLGLVTISGLVACNVGAESGLGDSRFTVNGYSPNVIADKETSCKYIVLKSNRGGLSITPLLKQDGTPDCDNN